MYLISQIIHSHKTDSRCVADCGISRKSNVGVWGASIAEGRDLLQTEGVAR